MHISIMLVFWSLVRNSVVLAVYFLFSVTCFFTVHEHYLEECSRSVGITSFDDVTHVRHAFLFFDQYSDFFLTLAQANLHSLMIFAINDYMLRFVDPIYPRSAYELYFYGGALLNVFLKWEEGGKLESVDEIVNVICRCCDISDA